MRVVRIWQDEDVRYGLADESTVTLISDEPFAAWEAEGIVPLSKAQLLAPVIPTKIVCVGVNYRGHAAEMGHELPHEPVIFMWVRNVMPPPKWTSRCLPQASAVRTRRP